MHDVLKAGKSDCRDDWSEVKSSRVIIKGRRELVSSLKVVSGRNNMGASINLIALQTLCAKFVCKALCPGQQKNTNYTIKVAL